MLLLAHRSTDPAFEADYRRCIQDLGRAFIDMDMKAESFIDFEGIYASGREEEAAPLRQDELSKVVLAQEDERKRLSRELHDSIAQELLTVSLKLRMARERTDDEYAGGLVDEALAEIDAVQSELHNLSVELRPSTLDNFGLVSALRSQAAVLERSYGVHVDFDVAGEVGRFDAAAETQVYRICQEAMLNSCKYSGADRIEAAFSTSAGWLSVSIADHGSGFDTAAPAVRGSGCGLSGMQERAQAIGGTLDVVSGDAGTTVALVAPMRAAGSRGQDGEGAS